MAGGPPGGYQQERYEYGLQAWRRRILPRLQRLTFPVIAGCLAFLVFAPATKAQFCAGGVAGGYLALYLWVRDEPPEHVRRHKEGADGERATGKALKPLLESGWQVVHDIDTGRGNRDHVLVGPGGVFLMESKKLGGRVTVEREVVHVERLDDERDSYSLPKLAAAVRGDAARLHDEIVAAARVNTWVAAVVVIWSPFAAGIVEGDRVVFIHGDELVGWLSARPERLDQQLIARIAENLG